MPTSCLVSEVNSVGDRGCLEKLEWASVAGLTPEFIEMVCWRFMPLKISFQFKTLYATYFFADIIIFFIYLFFVIITSSFWTRIDRERKHHTHHKAEEQNIYKQETLSPGPRGPHTHHALHPQHHAHAHHTATLYAGHDAGTLGVVGDEKPPAVENYENEIEKLKRKIKRELSFVSDEGEVRRGEGGKCCVVLNVSKVCLCVCMNVWIGVVEEHGEFTLLKLFF